MNTNENIAHGEGSSTHLFYSDEWVYITKHWLMIASDSKLRQAQL
ncbi:MAG TPA: hypothetical protein VE954_35930 [Oligoflexus sp.]|nr:hypothetical protein [Oligoflexus sp.]HYX38523.1 hypothetical protein [Oligoflexus sp.]